MTDSWRPDNDSSVPPPGHHAAGGAAPAEGSVPADPPAPVSDMVRLFGGGLAGIAAGFGMFVTLAVVSLAKGRDFWYPLHAVQALMSGRRVLPEARGTLRGDSAVDVVVAPILFLLPAIVVGVATAWWMRRRARVRTAPEPWWVVALVAAVLTGVAFVVFVVILGFRVASPGVQRSSTGYGVRQLGLAAWIAGHLVYVVVLVAVLEPLTRAVSGFGSRTRATRRLRGEREPKD